MTGTFFAKLRLILHEVSFSTNTIFRLLRETLNAGRVKLFAEALELFTHAVFQLVVVRKTAHLGGHTAAGQKDVEVGAAESG